MFSDATDSITQSQSLSDSKGTNLVSKNGGFVLGFFSTGNSPNRYLGIWYNNIPVRTVVWVANRRKITDSSGVLKLNSSGSLLLFSQNKTIAWLANPVYNFTFVSNKDEVYFIYQTTKDSVITRAVLNQTLYLFERNMWVEAGKKWFTYITTPGDKCDSYNLCGAYGNCIIGESPICQCIEGFKLKSTERWNPEDWAKGCVRTKELGCEDKDKIGFVKFVGLKLPDTTYSWVNESMNLNGCKVKC